MYRQFKHSAILRSAHSVFMCFVWIWEQTAIISLYNINWLVCITETECVYCAVRTVSLYITQIMCFVWIWEQTAIISLYNTNWLVCITETECVYCAVRIDYLYVYNWSIHFIWNINDSSQVLEPQTRIGIIIKQDVIKACAVTFTHVQWGNLVDLYSDLLFHDVKTDVLNG